MLNIFSCPYWSSVYLLWISAYSGPLPIFKLGCLFFCCWVVYVLYIFWKLTSSDVWFANIFSHSIGCLFILMMVFFSVQKVFHFIDPICLFLLLFPLLLSQSHKNTAKNSTWLLLMLSFSNWMVSSLKFKYLIHIKLILCMV